MYVINAVICVNHEGLGEGNEDFVIWSEFYIFVSSFLSFCAVVVALGNEWSHCCHMEHERRPNHQAYFICEKKKRKENGVSCLEPVAT